LLVDGGFNLSGGEKERIILARAIVTKPKILILDETLSEVNEDLELEIIENLKDYLKDSTIIYISHHKQIPNFRTIELNNNV
jgi:ABC-type bacteriocin/lantibiotic exporter with double-glycine peptidase domain